MHPWARRTPQRTGGAAAVAAVEKRSSHASAASVLQLAPTSAPRWVGKDSPCHNTPAASQLRAGSQEAQEHAKHSPLHQHLSVSLWSVQRMVPHLDGSSQLEGEEVLADDDGDNLLAAYLSLPKQATPDAAAAGPGKRAGKKGSRTARSQSPLLMDDDLLLDPSPGAAAVAATGGVRGAVAAAAAAVVSAVTRSSKRNKGGAAAANGGPSPDMVRQAAAQQRLLREQLAQATAAAAEDEDEEIEILDSDDGECVCMLCC